MNVRLFIAITPPQTVIDEIGTIQTDARKVLTTRGVRWQSPEKWHITLEFLGNVHSDLIDELTGRLREISPRAPFRLTLADPGAFPSIRRPRVLWLGFTGDVTALRDLQLEINKTVSMVTPVEEARDFTPHLTLARIKVPLHSTQLQTLATWSSTVTPNRSSWIVEDFELWESIMDRAGSRYIRLSSFPFVSRP